MDNNIQNMFIDDEKEIKQSKKTVHSSDSDNKDEGIKNIPTDYIPIKLSSLGKLDAPKILHVRNYTGQDALDLSITKDENIMYALIKVLKNMIYEEFDPGFLHHKELEEILLNIYMNFWGSSIQDYPYPWDENELQKIDDEDRAERIRRHEEIPRINIPLNLKTNNMDPKFKEPIHIKNGDLKISFILPRVGHVQIAKEYVDDLYFDQENELADIKANLEHNKNLRDQGINHGLRKIDKERYKIYDRLQEQKAIDFLTVQQSQTIVAVNDSKIQSLKDKIKQYNNTSLVFWKKFNDSVVNKIIFGVDENITVVSPLTNEEVIRRFQFRLLDFIPALDSEGTTEYSISFGT